MENYQVLSLRYQTQPSALVSRPHSKIANYRLASSYNLFVRQLGLTRTYLTTCCILFQMITELRVCKLMFFQILTFSDI